MGTTASQSSTLDGAGLWHAIDGSTDGHWWNGSVTHATFEDQLWCQVDLGIPHSIVTPAQRTRSSSARAAIFYVSRR